MLAFARLHSITLKFFGAKECIFIIFFFFLLKQSGGQEQSAALAVGKNRNLTCLKTFPTHKE